MLGLTQLSAVKFDINKIGLRKSLLNKNVSKININDLAKILNKVAVVDKELAEEMVEHGLRGSVTAKFLRETCPENFSVTGRLTETGKSQLSESIQQDFMKPEAVNTGAGQKFIKNLTVGDYIGMYLDNLA